jgi:polyhydroxybutyrate depolymerase
MQPHSKLPWLKNTPLPRNFCLMILFGGLSIGCPSGASFLTPGDYRFELTKSGRTRTYWIHVPPQAISGPLPLVINLHGGGGNARQHRRSSGMDEAADRDGYIAVYPNGTGRWTNHLLTWNAGDCCGYAQNQGIDDVGFISALIDDIERRAAIDFKRIYIVGHSNGGMMAHRLGDELPERIAAIASVAGAHMPFNRKGRSVPVLQLHSVDDPRALYEGSLGPPFPLTGMRVMHSSVQATVSAWIQRNGCDSIASEKELKKWHQHTAQLWVYGNCRNGAEVALWKLSGAGHGWPGAEPKMEVLLGPATKVIDANTEVWRFFSRFSLSR